MNISGPDSTTVNISIWDCMETESEYEFKFITVPCLLDTLGLNLAALKCEFGPNKDFEIVSEEYLNA